MIRAPAGALPAMDTVIHQFLFIPIFFVKTAVETSSPIDVCDPPSDIDALGMQYRRQFSSQLFSILGDHSAFHHPFSAGWRLQRNKLINSHSCWIPKIGTTLSYCRIKARPPAHYHQAAGQCTFMAINPISFFLTAARQSSSTSPDK